MSSTTPSMMGPLYCTQRRRSLIQMEVETTSTIRCLHRSNWWPCAAYASLCLLLSGAFSREVRVQAFLTPAISSMNSFVSASSAKPSQRNPKSIFSGPNRCSTPRTTPRRSFIGDGDEILNANFTGLAASGNLPDNHDLDWGKIKHQIAAYTEMSLPYFKESNAGRWLLAGMIGMTLLNSGVSVLFSYVGRDFWSALSSKDPAQFTQMMIKFSGALVVGAPVSVYYRYQREKLAIEWREWMTDRTLQLYSSNRVYYALERGKEIDNPDQRIAEDVRSFTSFSLELIITAITSVIDLVSFSAILYSIQPQLFGAIVAYAAFGTITTTALGRKLVSLNFERLFREADFRYSLVRIRDNAESIAFYAGEDIEGKEVSKRLNKVIDNRRDINVAQRNLEFFTTAYRYLIQVLPVAVVAPQFFAGKIELGVVSQSNGAFNHILSDLSIIVNQFESLASFSAGIDRLSQFMQTMREVDSDRPMDSPLMSLPNITDTLTTSDAEGLTGSMTRKLNEENGVIQLHRTVPVTSNQYLSTGAQRVLSVKGLYLTTPDRKRTLISNLSFSLKKGDHLLIVGNSGAGKSSLLRAIAGLWTSGSGTIERLSDEDVYFLPQRPYCTLGTLKDQLLYPSMDHLMPEDYPEGHRLSKAHLVRQQYSNQDLLKILDSLGLSELPTRAGDGDPVRGLSTVADWSNTLSLGEQQRLAFGRVLVNRPHLVVCDEATSALDMEAERRMYELLERSVSDATIVSVGHRPSLMRYHDLRLRVSADSCDLTRIDQSILNEETSILFENM